MQPLYMSSQWTYVSVFSFPSEREAGDGSTLPMYHATFSQVEGLWQIDATIFPTSFKMAGFVLSWCAEDA